MQLIAFFMRFLFVYASVVINRIGNVVIIYVHLF